MGRKTSDCSSSSFLDYPSLWSFVVLIQVLILYLGNLLCWFKTNPIFWYGQEPLPLIFIGPIFLHTIPIPVQAQKIWTWTGIIFDWMILSRIFVFRDHSQQPIIVYEVSLLNFDNVCLYYAHYVPYYLWWKSRNTGSIPFEPEPGLGSFAEILGLYCT